MKIIVTTVLFWISSLSMGQNHTNDHYNTDTIKNKISEKKQGTDKLVDQDKDHILMGKSNNKSSYTEKEWKKIKQGIEKNKRKFSTRKYTVHTTILIDTIYVDIPLPNSK